MQAQLIDQLQQPITQGFQAVDDHRRRLVAQGHGHRLQRVVEPHDAPVAIEREQMGRAASEACDAAAELVQGHRATRAAEGAHLARRRQRGEEPAAAGQLGEALAGRRRQGERCGGGSAQPVARGVARGVERG